MKKIKLQPEPEYSKETKWFKECLEKGFSYDPDGDQEVVARNVRGRLFTICNAISCPLSCSHINAGQFKNEWCDIVKLIFDHTSHLEEIPIEELWEFTGRTDIQEKFYINVNYIKYNREKEIALYEAENEAWNNVKPGELAKALNEFREKATEYEPLTKEEMEGGYVKLKSNLRLPEPLLDYSFLAKPSTIITDVVSDYNIYKTKTPLNNLEHEDTTLDKVKEIIENPIVSDKVTEPTLVKKTGLQDYIYKCEDCGKYFKEIRKRERIPIDPNICSLCREKRINGVKKILNP